MVLLHHWVPICKEISLPWAAHVLLPAGAWLLQMDQPCSSRLAELSLDFQLAFLSPA